MIRSVHLAGDGSIHYDLPIVDIEKAFKDKDGKIWISLENTDSHEINRVLRDICHFHPLSIEDCLGGTFQTPKMDVLENYLFFVLQALKSTNQDEEVQLHELNIFLGDTFLVTSFLDDTMSPIEKLWKQIKSITTVRSLGMDTFCHLILDNLVDEYLPAIEWMVDDIESIEDNILTDPGKDTMQKVLDLKHDIMHIRHVNFPHRDIMTHLSRDEFPQISPNNRIYFRDIYDHLVRLQDSLETARDSITSTLEIYLSQISIRQNEIMKTLTIVSTIFLPLTFLAGVYGMNFHFFPEITWILGYPLAWFIFISITVGMLIFFKKRKWL